MCPDGIVVGERCRRFEKTRHDLPRLEPVFPDEVGVGESLFHVAEVPVILDAHVVRPVVVDHRGAFLHGLFGIKYTRQVPHSPP